MTFVTVHHMLYASALLKSNCVTTTQRERLSESTRLLHSREMMKVGSAFRKRYIIRQVLESLSRI